MADDIVKQMQIGSPDWGELPIPVGDPGMAGRALDVAFGGPMVRNIMETEPVTEAEPFQIPTPTQGNVRGAVRDIGQQALPALEAGTRQAFGAPAMTPQEQAKITQFGGRAAELGTEVGLYAGIGGLMMKGLGSLLPKSTVGAIEGSPAAKNVENWWASKSGRVKAASDNPREYIEGLDKMHQQYVQNYNAGKLSTKEMARASRNIDILKKEIPAHLAEDMRMMVDPVVEEMGLGGVMRPTGSHTAEVAISPGVSVGTVPGHEVGHFLMERLRGQVRDKMLGASGKLGLEGTRRIQVLDKSLTNMRNLTHLGRGTARRYKSFLSDAYRRRLVNTKQYHKMYSRYYNLYHKLPTDELIVQEFSNLITKGVTPKEALKRTVKTASRVSDKQHKLIQVMDKNVTKLEKLVGSEMRGTALTRKVDGLVKEFEQAVQIHGKEVGRGFTAELSKQNMMNDIQKVMLEEQQGSRHFASEGDLGSFMDSLENKSYDQVRQIWDEKGAIRTLPGAPARGKWVRGKTGKPEWKKSRMGGQLPTPTPEGTPDIVTGMTSRKQLPQLKGALGREKVEKLFLKHVVNIGDTRVSKMLERNMHNMTIDQMKKFIAGRAR